jgi:hypothetical protein
MNPAVELHAAEDVTDVPWIVRGAVKLGLMESVFVLLFSLASRFLPAGPVETIVLAIILFTGLAAVAFLPGLWTRARTIEGIAGAAGIGLAATVVFMLIDVSILQNVRTYTNRWLAIGGGSNWWYHPVWWMVGTFIPWMGAWLLANRTERTGEPGAPVAFGIVIGCTIIAGVLAVVIGIPGAGWNLPTFGVAFLPGIALATTVSVLGSRRG